jgi:hypothetical protein
MGWVVSTTPQPLYPWERPGTHCTGGWVGERVWKILPPVGFDPRTFQPILSCYAYLATRPLIFIMSRKIPWFIATIEINIGTEEYSLAQQYVLKLIKPGYMFQLYSHHQAYLQSLVMLFMLIAYAVWDPSSEAKILLMELNAWTVQWIENEQSHKESCMPLVASRMCNEPIVECWWHSMTGSLYILLILLIYYSYFRHYGFDTFYQLQAAYIILCDSIYFLLFIFNTLNGSCF